MFAVQGCENGSNTSFSFFKSVHYIKGSDLHFLFKQVFRNIICDFVKLDIHNQLFKVLVSQLHSSTGPTISHISLSNGRGALMISRHTSFCM